MWGKCRGRRLVDLWGLPRKPGRLAGVRVFNPVQHAFATGEQIGAAEVHVVAHAAGEGAQGGGVARIAVHQEVVDPAEPPVGVQVCLFDEASHAGAQCLAQRVGIEPAQQLKVEVDLHIEVVQAEVAEVAVEEGIVGDLVERLRSRIFQTVVIAEGIAEQTSFRHQLGFQPGTRIGLGTAEVEGVLDVAPHEAQIDQNIVHRRIRLEHQQVVGHVDAEVVQDAERVQYLGERVLAIQVAEAVFGGVFHAKKDAEQAEPVEDAYGLLGYAVGRALTAMAMPVTPASASPSRIAANRSTALSALGRKKLSS